ncbi:MAG: hypothetical protein LUQ09_08540 [Methanomassiliicoccales archaeon]|nr:hypothetical protein [Methanomassiliicoccales archaeon]
MHKMDPGRSLKLEEFMDGIGYHFKRVELLDEALTHCSIKGEIPDARDYERLEFLGDTVLGYIVTKRLVERDREASESDLSDKRIDLVKNEFLNETGDRLGILDYVIIGNSVKTNAQEPKKMAADAVEAVIGAIFVDRGERYAQAFIERFIIEKEDLRRTFPRSSSRTSRYRAWIPFLRRH